MSALEAGASAPVIQLPWLNGGEFSLDAAHQSGPVVLAFFKVSCPVCQFAFPFLERIYKAYIGSGKFTFAGISQDETRETTAFNRQFGVTFPVALDDTRKYPASNAYGLTNVPSIFLISSAGEIDLSSVGWSKPDIERLNQELARLSGVAPSPLFKPGEKAPDFKPG